MTSFKNFLVSELDFYNLVPTNSTIEVSLLVSEKKKELVHKLLIIRNKNKKKNTASTKTRSEVRGGGKKPWRQKGTGRARAGSNRSPLWRGGGVIFGPKPKTNKTKLKSNKKERELALFSLIYQQRENLIVLNNPSFCILFEKTNLLSNFLKKIEKNYSLNSKINYLFIMEHDKIYQQLKRVSKNLKNVNVVQASCLNPFLFLKKNQKIFISSEHISYLSQISQNIGG